jgi:hypothetical protein
VAERYGVVVEPFKVYALDRSTRMGSSFDYRIIGVTDAPVDDTSLREMFAKHGPGILECKNVDGRIFRANWKDGEAPGHIEVQVQHQLALTDIPWSVIAALVGGNEVHTLIRERDPRVAAGLRAKIAEFWRTIEADEAPPAIMPDDADAVIALYQYASDGVYDATGNIEVASLLSEYEALRLSIKASEERMSVIKATILPIAGENGTLISDVGRVSLTQTKDSPGRVITAEMVGTTIGARSGYRMFRFTPKK